MQSKNFRCFGKPSCTGSKVSKPKYIAHCCQTATPKSYTLRDRPQKVVQKTNQNLVYPPNSLAPESLSGRTAWRPPRPWDRSKCSAPRTSAARRRWRGRRLCRRDLRLAKGEGGNDVPLQRPKPHVCPLFTLKRPWPRRLV